VISQRRTCRRKGYPLFHPAAQRLRNRRGGLARILVTGAGGFIGRALCAALTSHGHAVHGVTRRPEAPIAGAALAAIGNIGPQTDWRHHLAGIDIVVHLANRAHRRAAEGDLDEPAAAAALARAAAACGVRRLVHMSSIRAIGDATPPGSPFRSGDRPRPRDAYGLAKLATERALAAAARDSGLECVILRPPLVYAPGVKGNLRALTRLVASGLPLPFAGIDNRRSLIARDNLASLTALACVHPAAAGRAWLARDAVDLSTPQLVAALAEGLGRPLRLYPVPRALLGAAGALPALGPLLSRLITSLQVDDGETRAVLGWMPATAPETGLAETARAFARRR
jgi:nucleoside-diphosphate-sugar epimerase